MNLKTDVPFQQLEKIYHETNLAHHIDSVLEHMNKGYTTMYASLALPADDNIFDTVSKVVSDKKNYNAKLIIVIGIGGSSLGAKAVYQACKGSFSYIYKDAPQLYFLETIDAFYQNEIIKIVENVFLQGESVVLNVITKSGTTTETILNFELMLSLFKKHRPHDYCNLIVVTSDENSVLHQRAINEKFTFLPIPKLVGGRFSVFSAVGLFPLLYVGIDCKQLLQGARDALKNNMSFDLQHNVSAQSALLLYMYYQQGYKIHDSFLFSVDLENIGKWYRQLIGESIGKEHDVNGNVAHIGIVPTISIGTIDLHSVAQLYLSSSYIYTMFVGIETNCNDNMNIFMQGTCKAYQKNKKPFSVYMLSDKNEYSIGQFLQYKMIEIMYLGFLLKINPFDQPHVELYKQEVKKILDC